jgi:hypothetical protein
MARMATPLHAAKRRALRRRHSAGAAMFVVAMTISVLVSVGVYALAAAANETRTAGNERQSTQTHYLADYGIVGAAHEVTSMRAQTFLGQMMDPKYRDSLCTSLPAPPAAYAAYPQMLACRRMGSAELGMTWTPPITVNYTGATAFVSTAAPGSLGPVPMTADFFVELTEPTQASAPAKYALDLSFCFLEITASSTGITQPVVNPAFGGTVAQSQFGSEGLETERARLVAGPVQCPK